MSKELKNMVFDLNCKVSIDYGDEKDFTAATIIFKNDKGKYIILDSIDDSTAVGEDTIKELSNTGKMASSTNNFNSSKVLSSFDYIVRNFEAVDDVVYMDCIEHLNSIKQALLKAQETEKENAYIEKILQVIKQEFKLELYAICKRRLELSTNANRDNLEKILEWLK